MMNCEDASQVARKVNEIIMDLNSQILEATNSAITEQVVLSMKSAL